MRMALVEVIGSLVHELSSSEDMANDLTHPTTEEVLFGSAELYQDDRKCDGI